MYLSYMILAQDFNFTGSLWISSLHARKTCSYKWDTCTVGRQLVCWEVCQTSNRNHWEKNKKYQYFSLFIWIHLHVFLFETTVHTTWILYLLLNNYFLFCPAVEQQIKELQAQKHLLEPRLEFTKDLPGGSRVSKAVYCYIWRQRYRYRKELM